MLKSIIVATALLCGCSSGGSITPTPPAATQAAAPTISASTSNGAQNGAVIVTLASATAGAQIHYTLDGSTPTSSSQTYTAPFLVASSITVKAFATTAGDTQSAVATKAFTPNITSGTLVWSDEFTNSTSSNAGPNPSIWTYDLATNCCGNNELETYCAYGSSTSPCNAASPNAFIAPGGGLNIVAENPSATTYTSARLKSQGLFSFMYGRIEAKILMPESQGMWPAFWMLGNNIASIKWPACGELDIMEHIDANNTPFGGPGKGTAPGYDWMQSSIHGTGLNGGAPYPTSLATSGGFSAATWHTYGMIWSKGKIQYYIDDPTKPYETFTPTNPGVGTWPFDQGPQFILLNLAVGGDWPGSPNSTTIFPSTMQVQYVRIYAN
jgi:beta-glucanase (GH16 family)